MAKNRYDCLVEITIDHLISFFSKKDYTEEEAKEIAMSIYLNKLKDFDGEPVEMAYNMASDAKCTNTNKNFDLTENLTTLLEISKLEDDWNGYNAKSFSNELIEKCSTILKDLDYQPDSVTPTGRDSIQFEYDYLDNYLEFEVYLDRITCLEVLKEDYKNAKCFEIYNFDTIKINEVVDDFYKRF